MGRLSVWYDTPPLALVARFEYRHMVTAQLALVGVRFERLYRPVHSRTSDSATTLLQAHERALARVLGQGEFSDWFQDLTEEADPKQSPEADLDEHVHPSSEVRIWLRGAALVSLHHGGRVLQVDCGAGDLIVIPAGLRHWLRPISRARQVCLKLRPDQSAVPIRPSGQATAAGYPPYTLPGQRCSDLAASTR